MTLLRTAALSDIGRVRRRNEDRLIADPVHGLFGVADGVGGLPGGAEAAQCAVDEVRAAIGETASGTEPDLVAIINRANAKVYALGTEISPAAGIGCTLTFGHVRGGFLHLAHVGDSRCYGWRKNELVQLTNDHSVENEARLRRQRGEVIYYHDADRNALTRCVGQPGTVTADLSQRPLRAGDRYLFCTDGITRLVRPHELEEAIARPAEPEPILRDIIALAIRRGGPDNATGVIVFVEEA